MLSRSTSAAVRPFVRHARCFAAKKNPFEEVGQFPNHSNKVNPPANVCSSWVKNSDLDAMFNNPNLKKRYIPIQLRQTGDGKGVLVALSYNKSVPSSRSIPEVTDGTDR